MRQISDINVRTRPNPMVRIATAQVLIADYGLIKKDFPFTSDWPNDRIDQWLLSQTGYLSASQAEPGHGVNSEVRTTGQTLEAYRPDGYGRGAVYPVTDPEGKPFGLIDAKGTGTEFPVQKSHSSGLMSSGEGLREFFYEKYISGILEHERAEWGTVGTYAVIDWGFDELHPDGSKVPAGFVLRQAHNRVKTGKPGYQYLNAGDSRTLETTLRPYGLTAIGDSLTKGNAPAVNLQGTPDHKLVDFGHFIQLESMPKRATGIYGGTLGMALLTPDDPDWVDTPRSEFNSTVAAWGPYPNQNADPKFDRISGEMHDLAQAFRDGRASRSDIARAYYGKVEGALSLVRGQPRPPAGETNPARIEGAYRAAVRILDTPALGNSPGGSAIALARSSGLPSPEWETRLLERVSPSKMGALFDGLASVEDVELAEQIISKGRNLQVWQITRYLSVFPNGDARKYKLIQTLLDSPQSNSNKMASIFVGLNKDTSREVIPLLVRALEDPTISKDYSPISLEEQLRRMSIWETMTSNTQRKLKQAVQLPPGPLRAKKLAFLLQVNSDSERTGCRVILYRALDVLQATSRSSRR